MDRRKAGQDVIDPLNPDKQTLHFTVLNIPPRSVTGNGCQSGYRPQEFRNANA